MYKDVAKPRALPVSTVVTKHSVEVTGVSPDGLQVKYEPTILATDQPVKSAQGFLLVIRHEAGQLVLQQSQAVEVGDVLQQDKMIDKLKDVFRAFAHLWQPMWQEASSGMAGGDPANPRECSPSRRTTKIATHHARGVGPIHPSQETN